ncbi:hypothetical protein EV121DRAFT_297646 [Schizophyllum commune]
MGICLGFPATAPTTQMPGGKKPKMGAGTTAKPPLAPKSSVKPLPTPSQLIQKLKDQQTPPPTTDRLAPGAGSRYMPLSNHSPEAAIEETAAPPTDQDDDEIIPDIPKEGVSTPVSVPKPDSEEGLEIVRFSPSQASPDEIDTFFQNISNANISGMHDEGDGENEESAPLQQPPQDGEDDDIRPHLNEDENDPATHGEKSEPHDGQDTVLIALPAGANKHTVLDDFNRVVRAARLTESEACERFRTIYLPAIVKRLDENMARTPAGIIPPPHLPAKDNASNAPAATHHDLAPPHVEERAVTRAAAVPAGAATPTFPPSRRPFNLNGETPGPFPPAYGLNKMTIAPDLPLKA